jgi:hypothetical protein
MPAPSLRELQGAFWRAISSPEPALEDGLLRVVAPSPALTPAGRVAIYGGMYFWRLLDVLREDFPKVVALVGDERFEALARAYLDRHPSQDPSVRHVGDALPAFLAAQATPAVVGDLARLERARLWVFDAPDPMPLTLDALRALAPESWPALRFAPIEALQVVVSDWPVQRVWDDPAAPVGPARTALRVWRQGFVVSHAVMDAAEETALAALVAGETFAALCERFADPETPAALLLRWIADGLVAGIR